jgi:hypothetical protein
METTTFRIYDRRNGNLIETVHGTTVQMHEAARRISSGCSPKTPDVDGAKGSTFDVRVVMVDGSERSYCGYDDDGHMVSCW